MTIRPLYGGRDAPLRWLLRISAAFRIKDVGLGGLGGIHGWSEEEHQVLQGAGQILLKKKLVD